MVSFGTTKVVPWRFSRSGGLCSPSRDGRSPGLEVLFSGEFAGIGSGCFWVGVSGHRIVVFCVAGSDQVAVCGRVLRFPFYLKNLYV